jgi:hypothetical protein
MLGAHLDALIGLEGRGRRRPMKKDTEGDAWPHPDDRARGSRIHDSIDIAVNGRAGRRAARFHGWGKLPTVSKDQNF